jgi:hypothetical protein
MMRLGGVKRLERTVLEKWGYKVRGRRNRCYSVKFPCPICGGDASEDFKELNEVDAPRWDIFFGRSQCGHIGGNYSCLTWDPIPVEGDRGETIAYVIPSPFHFGQPFWERRELEDGADGTDFERSLPARFGTLCQAIAASVDECRLLALMQAESGM